MDKHFKVGLIGFGMGGCIFHAPSISSVDELQLAAIRETKEDRIQLIRQQYPGTTVVASTADILDDPAIDIVVISTPNASHYSLAKAALLAGKHVVIDKPFTVNSTDADELILLALEKNKVLTVFQSRRFDADFKTVKKIIDSGMLGDIVEYEAHFDRFRNFIRPGTWKESTEEGTGILYDLGSHLIDQALVLFGLPLAVMADLQKQRTGSQVVDHFDLVLFYPGMKARLKAGMLVKEAFPRYIILGQNGSFVKYGTDVQEAALNAGLRPRDNPAWGKEPEAQYGTLNVQHLGIEFRGKVTSETGDYAGFYQNLYEHLAGKAPLVVKPAQARETIRIIELAMQSNEEKRTIPW